MSLIVNFIFTIIIFYKMKNTTLKSIIGVSLNLELVYFEFRFLARFQGIKEELLNIDINNPVTVIPLVELLIQLYVLNTLILCSIDIIKKFIKGETWNEIFNYYI